MIALERDRGIQNDLGAEMEIDFELRSDGGGGLGLEIDLEMTGTGMGLEYWSDIEQKNE
jgi:hypothetical protein